MEYPDETPDSGVVLLRNIARCDKEGCGDVIESTTTHDFATCGCGSLSVDGGLSYRRRAFNGPWTELSEWKMPDGSTVGGPDE